MPEQMNALKPLGAQVQGSVGQNLQERSSGGMIRWAIRVKSRSNLNSDALASAAPPNSYSSLEQSGPLFFF